MENTSLAVKEPDPPVQIEVTKHVEEDGDTHTEVQEEKTTKQDGDVVEEKTEVTTTTKRTTPTGGKFTFQTKETTTKTTAKKTFLGEFNILIFMKDKTWFKRGYELGVAGLCFHHVHPGNPCC